MKITFEETVDEKEWIHTELLISLPPEVINQANENQFYEVHLLVNGIKLEPKLFNQIITNLEKHIENQAEFLIKGKLKLAEEEAQRLVQIVEECTRSISEKFNINL